MNCTPDPPERVPDPNFLTTRTNSKRHITKSDNGSLASTDAGHRNQPSVPADRPARHKQGQRRRSRTVVTEWPADLVRIRSARSLVGRMFSTRFFSLILDQMSDAVASASSSLSSA